SSLNQLVATEGTYSLLIHNQAPETQRLDELKLIAIDHDSTKTVYVDPLGTFHLHALPTAAASATDQLGRDITPFFTARHRAAWQSALPKDDADTLQTRDTLTITIPNH